MPKEFKDSDTIERCPHDIENPFVMINRQLIRDMSISPGCRWLIIFLLSNKDGWKINIKQIASQAGDCVGRDKIYQWINEAIEAGYIKREEFCVNNLKRYRYILSETPKFKKCFRCPESQDTGSQDTERQETEKPDSKDRESIRKNIDKEKYGYKTPETGPRPKGPDKEKKEPSSESLEVAQELLKSIQTRLPSFKEPDLKKWALEAEKMMVTDKRSMDSILHVIDFLKISFWGKIVVSPKKLREKFDVICLEMIEKRGRKEWMNRPQKESEEPKATWSAADTKTHPSLQSLLEKAGMA